MAPNRRNFIRGAGGLLAAGTIPGVVAAEPAAPTDPRARKALQMRMAAAQAQSLRPPADTLTNGDETRYPASLIGTFTKGMPHSQSGEVDAAANASLARALATQNHGDAEKIVLGFGRKFVNFESAFAYEMDGGDPHTFSIPVPPAFDSSQAAAEMVELYWQALARDVPFAQWDSSPVIQNAAAELDRVSGYKGPRDASGRVTPANVFRGILPGAGDGPYLSQYLLKPIFFGSTPREQTYRTSQPNYDYMTDYSEYILVQSGIPPYREPLFDSVYRYMRSGRDLAEAVHWDYTYQFFLQAALIIFDQHPETILNFNLYQLNHTNPYKTSRIQTGFTTFGSAHILDWVARMANLALKATCYQKWAVHRRARPEAFAGSVYNTLNGSASYPIHADLLGSQALRATVQSFGGALLPQAYLEGSPLHPSYPGGHAAIAGACTTILKAFFEETDLVSGSVTASVDGLSLVPADGLGLTIGGELNKLAFNIGMGRNFAGIHYRSDLDAGLALGEEVAIAFMQDQVNTFTEPFGGFDFTRFNGTRMTISPN